MPELLSDPNKKRKLFIYRAWSFCSAIDVTRVISSGEPGLQDRLDRPAPHAAAAALCSASRLGKASGVASGQIEWRRGMNSRAFVSSLNCFPAIRSR